MKRIACIVLVLLTLCGCRQPETFENTGGYVTGVWLSYSEIDSMLETGGFKTEFRRVVTTCTAKGITDMFVHVRPFCDALYTSEYFPLRESASGQGIDVLEYMTEICHKSGLRIHAWINPYRVSHSADAKSLPKQSPAYIWLNDDDAENDTNVCITDGIYLNPASSEVRRLVIDGIREIILNYEVDGIHFDDYFYPTQSEEFDASLYEDYSASASGALSLGDWRRANVNALISGCYTAVKFIDKDIVFSVSPAASIEYVYESLYADVESWVKSGCVDYIIPQLYFGFEYPNEEYRFENLLADWKKITENSQVKLLVGLASYKKGTENEPDREEWQDPTVITRQAQLCKADTAVWGHVFFSYSSL